MRHMLCVGFSYHVFGSRHSNRGEHSNWYVPYTKQVRFGGLALLDGFFASSKSSPFTCRPWCMTLLSDGHLASGVESRGIAVMIIYMSHMLGDK